MAIKERCLDVHLMQNKTPLSRNTEDNSNRGEFGNGRKYLFKVDAILLQKTISNKSSLVSLDESFNNFFYRIHPLASYRFSAAWQDHKLPCLILGQRFKLRCARFFRLARVAVGP